MTTLSATVLDEEEVSSTFDIDAEFEELLAPLKPGQGLEIALKPGLTMSSAMRHAESAARRVLQRRLEFAYRADGKALRIKVTDIRATDYGRRSRRRFTEADRATGSPGPVRITVDETYLVTDVERTDTE